MKKNKKHTLINLIFLIFMFGFVVHVEANEASSSKHDIKTANFGNLDYENVDHLVIIHKKATPQDIQFSDDSMRLAKEIMQKENNLFPRVQLEEAITTYPTPEIIISFANGFLKVAQTYGFEKDANLLTSLGNNNVEWYFKGAEFYYGLATEFAQKINQPFNTKTNHKIASTTTCIRHILANGISSNLNPCEPIDL